MPAAGRRSTQVASTVVVVLLMVATWWLQSRGGEAEPQARDEPTSSARPSQDASAPGEQEASGPGESVDDDGLPWVDLADLPAEAARTVELIDHGGPFPYPEKDGSTFGNFEGLLPDRPRGYYAEYTVPTPGEDDRGARRIVAGDGGELYWTEDHYASFERIRR